MNVLRVLTLNIWNRQGPWEARLERIQTGIAALAPDVVALQEVLSSEEGSQADDIGRALGYRSTFGSSIHLGGGVHVGNATLARWPLRRREVFPLRSASDDWASLLLAEYDSPLGRLPVFVTHLSWKFHHGVIREGQVQQIAEVIQREVPLRSRALPPILAGDMNAQPDATEMRFLRGLHALGGKSVYFADCHDVAGEGPGYTFDGTTNPYAAPLHEPRRRIDYIFVRGPEPSGRGKPLACRVVMDDVVAGVAASDHNGVYAEVAY